MRLSPRCSATSKTYFLRGWDIRKLKRFAVRVALNPANAGNGFSSKLMSSTPNDSFDYIAVTPTAKGKTAWLEPVTDKYDNSAK